MSAGLQVGEVARTFVVSGVAFVLGQLMICQCVASLEERLGICGEQVGPRLDYSVLEPLGC